MGLILIDKECEKIEAITFDDLDIDNELPITAFDNAYDTEMKIYLTKENVKSLKKHLDYILKKM